MILKISSSPYIHNQQTTQHIMLLVILASLPGLFTQWYFFGYGVLVQIGLAVLTAICAEAAILQLRHKPIGLNLKDNSALLTALLLGLSLPPLSPWWLIVLGTLFAIVVAKQLYGGLGHNLFNPAMVGYVALLISFPVQMTSWLPASNEQISALGLCDTVNMIFSGHTSSGLTLQELLSTTDGVTQATPLDTVKTALHQGVELSTVTTHFSLFEAPNNGWLWINISFLIGGLFLLLKRIVYWQIPCTFLLTLLLCSTLSWLIDPQQSMPPYFFLFSGATMLGAFFIATDPVTAATTPQGRLIFGILIGLLVWLIRSFGGYPDGVAFAVLIANITVPLIDHYTQPRVYGH